MKRRYIPLAIALLVIAIAPLVLPEFTVTLLNYIGLYALVALGLLLLTGIGGLTSFGQAAFVGIGAYTTAYLTTAHGLSPWFTLFAGLIVTAAIAFFLGAMTLRMEGHYLPLSTIAWGISLYFLAGNLEFLGGFTGISDIPALSLADVEITSMQHFYYLIWALLLLAMWGIHNLLDSRPGRAIRALKGGTVMAEAMGVNTHRAKLTIFMIAALLASLSGWLYAHMQRFVSPTPFALNQGIEYLFMAVVGGAGSVWGAVLGAGVITIVKQWLQDQLPKIIDQSGDFEIIVFGIVMVLVLQYANNGIWSWLARWWPAAEPPAPPKADAANALPRRSVPAPGTTLLQVQDVTKRFGGLVANNKVSLHVNAGEILALIGPNGAGKSTLFNCISGVAPASEGSITLNDKKVGRMPPRRIAQMGLSRTFQHVRLLGQMSVLENVALGAHMRGQQGVMPSMLRLQRVEENRLLAEAARQIEHVGLKEQMFAPAASLALGQQRLVEIARALCADPTILLLDEPAAGLRYLEKQALADLLKKLRAEGMGILLVEHDMDFVMGLADRVVVMEFGEKIAEGSPDAVQRDPRVLEAYLGGVE